MTFLTSVASFSALIAGAAPAFAQNETTLTPETAETSTADLTGQVGDIIVVTATRRSQALSDVPIAISAVSGEQMANSGASDIRQLVQISPSLFVTNAGADGASAARIRNIGTVGENVGLEALGRHLRRRRLSQPLGYRAQRARRDRPDRGRARPAGHAVGAQFDRRPDQHLHAPSGI